MAAILVAVADNMETVVPQQFLLVAAAEEEVNMVAKVAVAAKELLPVVAVDSMVVVMA